MSVKKHLVTFFLVAVLPVSTYAAADPIMPLDQVRKGMQGYGLTVFEGNRVERFDVEIFGVLRNIGPGQNLILAHVDSKVIKDTGVIAGMSGSPVYVDGKVIGALAYSWQFSRDSVAGITPIEDMLRIDSHQGGGHAGASPISTADFVSFLSSASPTSAFIKLTQDWPQRGSRAVAGAALPIATPISIAGIRGDTAERFGAVFSQAGFLLVPTGTSSGSSGTDAVETPAFVPGDAISAVLVDGDFSLAATGTVTHVRGDNVYGFGHPFLDMGTVAFPMAKADVVGVLPSLAQSFKFSNTGTVVGTFVQDRSAGILGRTGDSADMVPVKLTLRGSRGVEEFNLRIVNHSTLMPLLMAMCTDSVISGAQKASGERTILMNLDAKFSDGRAFSIREGWSGAQARGMIPQYLAVLLSYLTGNPFDAASVSSLDIDLKHTDELQTAEVVDATLIAQDADGRIRPGSLVRVRATVRPWRGESYKVELPLQIPADASPGSGYVIVGSGTLDNQLRFGLVPPDPRNLDDLIDLVSQLRPSTEISARMLLPLDGRVTGGAYHPALPPSMAALIDDDASHSGAARVRLAPGRQVSRDLEQVVSGVTRIDFRIEPRS